MKTQTFKIVGWCVVKHYQNGGYAKYFFNSEQEAMECDGRGLEDMDEVFPMFKMEYVVGSM